MKSLNLLIIGFFLLLGCSDYEQNNDSPAHKPQTYSIEQFYKSSNALGGAFSSDDSLLLISSNETGIYNAYEINIATGAKKALTQSTHESIFGNDYVPGTHDFIYSSDRGGNENNHLYLQRTNGTTTDLTPGEKEKATFWGWSQDQKSLYYISNKRDPRFFDLYKMGISNWVGQLIYKNDLGYDIGAISPDERFFALVENITTSATNLYLADQQEKTVRRINTAGIESANTPLQFALNNQFLYYTTDEGGEYQHVVQVYLENLSREKVYSTNWDVQFMTLSRNEKYQVIGVNEDGRDKRYLINLKTRQPIELPAMDNGYVQDIAFSPSENFIRLTIGDSKSPNNIFVYSFANGSLRKLTNTLTSEIDPQDLVAAEVIRYKSFDELEIPAIYYKPQMASADHKVPALVLVHGGPGGQSRVGYSPLIQYLVNHGYAVLAVNNRGSSGYGKTFYKMDDRNHGDKDLKDCIWGKKYLASLHYIDSSSIGIMGGSYGGYITLAALAFHPDAFKVGVDLFGVANWLRTLKEIPPYWESFRHALYKEIGDPNTSDTIRLKAYSPLLHAAAITKPLMVLQGANDPRVLQVESDEVVAAVRKNGVPVEYIIFPDEGHGFVKKENEVNGYGQILKFLETHLKGEKKPE